MTTETSRVAAFARAEHLNEPAVLGARWWSVALGKNLDARPLLERRDLFRALGASLAGCAVGGVAATQCGREEPTARLSTLVVQRRYGWAFGAREVPLPWPFATYTPARHTALDALAETLRPTRWAEVYDATLFESPDAVPQRTDSEEPGTFQRLRSALALPADERWWQANQAGVALREALPERTWDVVVVIDLAGPASVAMAAGLAGGFEPVIGVANWPHPRGVVPSHEVLCAAMHFEEDFAAARAARYAACGLCVALDRRRLAAYRDGADQFDNRYVASLPPASLLLARSVRRALYVAPSASDLPERDDLHDALLAWERAGITVQAVTLDDFEVAPEGGLRVAGAGTSREAVQALLGWDGDDALPRPHGYVPTPRRVDITRPGTIDAAAVEALAHPTEDSEMRRSGSWNRSTHWHHGG
jgi:hypothetical protein